MLKLLVWLVLFIVCWPLASGLTTAHTGRRGGQKIEPPAVENTES